MTLIPLEKDQQTISGRFRKAHSFAFLDEGEISIEKNPHKKFNIETLMRKDTSNFAATLNETNGRFRSWMIRLDGGKRDRKTAEKHNMNISFVINEINPQCFSDFVDPRTILNIVDTRVKSEIWKASTGKLYLFSISFFLKYLLSKNIIPLSKKEKDEANLVIDRVTKWRQSFRKLVSQTRFRESVI